MVQLCAVAAIGLAALAVERGQVAGAKIADGGKLVSNAVVLRLKLFGVLNFSHWMSLRYTELFILHTALSATFSQYLALSKFFKSDVHPLQD